MRAVSVERTLATFGRHGIRIGGRRERPTRNGGALGHYLSHRQHQHHHER